jgi:hypothetical protein
VSTTISTCREQTLRKRLYTVLVSAPQMSGVIDTENNTSQL